MDCWTRKMGAVFEPSPLRYMGDVHAPEIREIVDEGDQRVDLEHTVKETQRLEGILECRERHNPQPSVFFNNRGCEGSVVCYGFRLSRVFFSTNFVRVQKR